MPTAKDMEFAKILISKELLSRAEMQRHLDDLDEMRQQGKNITLGDLLIQRQSLTPQELSHLMGPKKRIVHCSKCNTMYRAQDVDVGKKFKCKKCGTFVIVPIPGQTQVRPVREIQKKDEALEEKNLPEIDTQKVIKVVTPKKSTAGKPPGKQPISASKQESTILLGLDSDEEEPEVVKTSLDRQPQYVTSKKPPQAQPPEATIMLDLEEKDEGTPITPEILHIAPEEVMLDPEATQVDPNVKYIVPNTKIATPISKDHPSIKPTAKESGTPEMTIMLDLDDDEEPLLVEDAGEIGGVHDIDAPPNKSAELEIGDIDEWSLSGYGGEGSENVDIETHVPSPPPVEEQQMYKGEIGQELEKWALTGESEEIMSNDVDNLSGVETMPNEANNVSGNEQEKVFLSQEEKQALSKWADETPPESTSKSQKPKTPEGKEPEMTIMLGLDDDDDEK